MLADVIDFSKVSSVLVTKLRHHGDVLLSSPVFTVLKRHAPHVSIDALVYQDTAEMLSLHPAIRCVHTIDRNWKRQGAIAQFQAEAGLIGKLRRARYDLIIHLTDHSRGLWLKWLSGARYGVARKDVAKPLWRRSFSHLYALPRGTPRHTVETDLDALRRLGVYAAADERALVLVPGPAAEERARQLMAEHQLHAKEFIHLHATSRWMFKCWTVSELAETIDALAQRFKIVLTAAPAARELAMIAEIKSAINVDVIDLAGQLSLKELAALIGQARLSLCVDSAPMHIAAAMQTPVVALFGPSSEIVWGPWQVKHRVIQSGHPCRPCGNDGCGGGKISECLTTLPASAVIEAINDLI